MSKTWLTRELENKCEIKRQFYKSVLEKRIENQFYKNYCERLNAEITREKTTKQFELCT